MSPRPGALPSALPPVRIYLGTEPHQHRAERVFAWSVERVRDPSRAYEIHLLRELEGFRRLLWTTGFTNYRFAIPHYTGGAGLAIYNDEDQIYLADPAELFDTPMEGCGYRAVSDDDTSVMLLDCARMASVWTLRDAQRLHKRQLTSRAARTPGLFGPIAPEWNARDVEYAAGRSKLLHYTTLHTQPWRPFPERFVYQGHAQAELWHELERSADAAGFQLFTRERPSSRYRPGVNDGIPPLEEVPDLDLPWVLDEMARDAGEVVEASVACTRERRSARGLGAVALTHHSPAWWSERFEAAARRHPEQHWRLELRHADDRRESREFGAHLGERAPRVWVLTDDRPGNTTQSTGLATALGWPTEVKRIVHRPLSRLHNRVLGASLLGVDRDASDPLDPPWPDLLVSAGRRNSPVALWIRERSGGRVRTVQLGRKSGDDPERFDLTVCPSYVRLLEHPRRVETSAPLHRIHEAALADAAEQWKERFGSLRSPRIALLVGGRSGQYQLDADSARRIGREVGRLAREAGGSVLASTSRRTGGAATRALGEALPEDAVLYRWRPDDPENPYLALLALADVFVVTGDSETMLAETASLGKPVVIFPLPERASFSALSQLRDWVDRRARAKPAGPRGTPRPQTGLEYLCARLIDRGLVRPARDLDRLHEDLAARGVARLFGDGAILEPLGTGSRRPPRDLERVADRVRRLMGTR